MTSTSLWRLRGDRLVGTPKKREWEENCFDARPEGKAPTSSVEQSSLKLYSQNQANLAPMSYRDV